jgi:hypothetical protein
MKEKVSAKELIWLLFLTALVSELTCLLTIILLTHI